MLHPYKHPLFSQWLSTVMLPEAQALFEEAELLLVNHYNTDEGMNLFNDNLLSQVDQLDTVDMVSQAQAYLIDNCITAIQEYGILIETPIDSSKFDILLAIFRTAMTIDTYEDPMAINQFLELGNSNNELFGEFVHLLYPNIQVEEVLPLLKEVFATFMDTIRANIKEVVLKQQELDEEDLREENQAKLKFIQGYEKTLNTYGIQLPNGVNRKFLKQVLRDFFTNITDELIEKQPGKKEGEVKYAVDSHVLKNNCLRTHVDYYNKAEKQMVKLPITLTLKTDLPDKPHLQKLIRNHGEKVKFTIVTHHLSDLAVGYALIADLGDDAKAIWVSSTMTSVILRK